MRRHEIEAWLCGPDTKPMPATDIAAALGVPLERLAASLGVRVDSLRRPTPELQERLRPYQLTVAVLRDIYSSDADVSLWLRTPRFELGGRPIDILLSGDPNVVESATVAAWRGEAA